MFESLTRKKQVLHQEVSHIHETPVYKNSILNEHNTLSKTYSIYKYSHIRTNTCTYIIFDTKSRKAHKIALSQIGQQ